MRDLISVLLSLIAILCSGNETVLLAEETLEGLVQVTEIRKETWDQVAPRGKEVDAIIGDFVLKNQYVTAVIAQPLASRNANMTVKGIAGCLIDFTVNDRSNDQLIAYYPGARKFPFRSWKVLDDRAQLLDIHQAGGQIQNAFGIEIQVTATASDQRAELVVSYRLNPDSRYLIVTQKYINKSKKEMPIFINDEVRLDGGKEDMLKSPNGTTDFFWGEDRYWKQAYGIVSFERQIISRSDSRRSTLRFGNRGSKPEIVLKPGEEISHRLHWYVASDLCDIRSSLAKQKKEERGNLVITVLASGTPLPNARIELSQDGKYIGTLWSDGSGRVEQSLLTGTYDLKVSFLGILLAENFQQTIQEEISPAAIKLPFKVGLLKINVTEGNHLHVPCKVQLIAKAEANKLDFAPESAEVTVKNLLYLHQGRHEVLLPVGDYEVIISRGPEYDAVFTDVVIKQKKVTVLNEIIKRVVDTAGWVSTDFHSHSSPSGDNTGSQLGRVLNLVCEQIEFAPCTEHNRIDTYVPHIHTLGIEKYLATCSGMELTGNPLFLNHQNVFPLVHKPHTQDGGGPVTDRSPEKQIQRAALWDNRSEKLIHQNHPDFGWLFFDKNGDGNPDSGYSESFPFIEAIEIHPLDSMLTFSAKYNDARQNGKLRNNRAINWLQLLNQGYRITGVVNTDSHYNYHGSGGLRNWVKCSTDNPSEIKTLDIVHATEKAHVIMSNGPFLSVSLTEQSSDKKNKMMTVIPGDELASDSDKFDLRVRVQCPNWFDIDRLFVLVNGKLHQTHDYQRVKDQQKFSDGVVKFDDTLPLELKEDAHIVVVAAGEHSQLGLVMGPNWGKQQPIAVSNPIFIDIAKDGFKPNKDPIYGTLPVKNK